MDFSNMRTFVTTPPPRRYVVQCRIARSKGALQHATYELSMMDGRFLMAARKKPSKTSNYLISMDSDNFEKGDKYLGKVRANFLGTEFAIYDSGAKPKAGNADDDAPAAAGALGGDARERTRTELGFVLYEQNIFGGRGPRKMTVGLPTPRRDGSPSVFRPQGEEPVMAARYKAGNADGMLILRNKPPKWNDAIGAFVLNFNGRVTMASVKNFQLVENEDSEDVYLQFGRVGKDEFNMDFTAPLTALQAFAICISSFDFKLGCE
jgi:tubby-related protein 1